MLVELYPKLTRLAPNFHLILTHVQLLLQAHHAGVLIVFDVRLLSVIRRWHFRGGMPIREITRRTVLSRNTVRN